MDRSSVLLGRRSDVICDESLSLTYLFRHIRIIVWFQSRICLVVLSAVTIVQCCKAEAAENNVPKLSERSQPAILSAASKLIASEKL